MFSVMVRLLMFLVVVLMATVSASASEVVTYFHVDPVGSPLAASDAKGNILWKENYRPFGDRVQRASASASNNVWFAGKPQEAATGLSYFGARYYDPVLGRFMGVDPAEVNPSDIHSFNRYAYANNGPYRFVDPNGRSPIDVVFLAYDVGKLGVAVYSGVGVGAAAADVGLSVLGVISPVPDTGGRAGAEGR